MSLKFDIPYKELAFQGAPHREMVNLQPSVDCLCNLTEVPAFVVTLNEITHVHFERLTFQAKNFDMVLIFEDFTREVAKITAIPMEHVEMIKEWLDDIKVTFSGGPAPLKWPMIMNTIRQEGEYFWMDEDEEGEKKPMGFEFLSAEASDDEGEDGESDESNFSEDMQNASSSEEEDEDEESLVDEDEESSDEDEDEVRVVVVVALPLLHAAATHTTSTVH